MADYYFDAGSESINDDKSYSDKQCDKSNRESSREAEWLSIRNLRKQRVQRVLLYIVLCVLFIKQVENATLGRRLDKLTQIYSYILTIEFSIKLQEN